MKIKILAITALCLLSTKAISQKTEKVNPKGKVYFGAEIGSNTINSFEIGGKEQYPQGGFLAEYYFARHWSLSARLKAFDTGVSFYQPEVHIDHFFFDFLNQDEYSGTFRGAVIAVPIDLKWEFRVFKNLGAGLKLGPAFTAEAKSSYSNYSNNLPTDLEPFYVAFNYGIGLNYFINEKTAVYIDYEGFSGASKGHSAAFLGSSEYTVQNELINFGIKYHFSDTKD